jgi:hypothetical protein
VVSNDVVHSGTARKRALGLESCWASRSSGLSMVVILFGGMFGLSESAAGRVSQIVFFPTFLGAYHYTNAGAR